MDPLRGDGLIDSASGEDAPRRHDPHYRLRAAGPGLLKRTAEWLRGLLKHKR